MSSTIIRHFKGNAEITSTEGCNNYFLIALFEILPITDLDEAKEEDEH